MGVFVGVPSSAVLLLGCGGGGGSVLQGPPPKPPTPPEQEHFRERQLFRRMRRLKWAQRFQATLRLPFAFERRCPF